MGQKKEQRLYSTALNNGIVIVLICSLYQQPLF